MSVMVLLMGEQPAANLLPARRYAPETILLVHTERTTPQAERFKDAMTNCNVIPLKVAPYDIGRARDSIQQKIDKNIDKGHWQPSDLLFNLTGGTKTMSLGAYDVAQQMGVPFLYLQTEGGKSRLYRYRFDDNQQAELESVDDLAESISLADYLGLYLDGYRSGPAVQDLEKLAEEALREGGLEVFTSVRPTREPNVEIDLVVRQGNQIGIAEVKAKNPNARGWENESLGQVVIVAGQRYLGTYVKRFLISNRKFHPNTYDLAKRLNVQLIELPSYRVDDEPKTLSPADQERLRQTVRAIMTGAPVTGKVNQDGKLPETS